MPNAQDTNKMSKVTDEMLENFAEPKTEQEPDKTIVEFNEDEVEEEQPKKKESKKPAFFLKGLGVILLIAFVGTAIFGI